MGFGASKRALKHGLHTQKDVTGSIKTMELQGVPLNGAWDFQAAALLQPHDSTLDRLFLI